MEALNKKFNRFLMEISATTNELKSIKVDIEDLKSETKIIGTLLIEEISIRKELEEKLKLTDKNQLLLHSRICEFALEDKNEYMEKLIKQKMYSLTTHPSPTMIHCSK